MAYTPNYPTESPYGATRIVGRFLSYYVHRRIPPHETDRLAQIGDERYVHRPDILARDIYGTEDYWWIIPVRNGFQDPVFDLKMDTDIIIPDPSYVRTIV